MIKKIFLLFFLILFVSCVSKKKLVYYQGIENLQKNNEQLAYEPTLQSDDLLTIIVSAPDPEAAMPYNLLTYSPGNVGSENLEGGNRYYQTYLIDSSGNIEFPVLGTIKMGGLTKTEASEKLKSELKKYITSPIVNMRIINFKYTISGEVVKPGVYNVQTERVTLPEAISTAGDLTIYGDRKEVLIIREVNGVKTHSFVDLTSADFINSPFYYLDQNDIVYISPNKTKINSSSVGPNLTVGISAISLLITIVALILR